MVNIKPRITKVYLKKEILKLKKEISMGLDCSTERQKRNMIDVFKQKLKMKGVFE